MEKLRNSVPALIFAFAVGMSGCTDSGLKNVVGPAVNPGLNAGQNLGMTPEMRSNFAETAKNEARKNGTVSMSASEGEKSTLLGPSCKSDNPSFICLALKYVVYTDGNNSSVINSEDAIRNINQINNVWRQCSVGFQIENYITARPDSYRLRYNPSDYSELDDIRKTFSDGTTLLVVTTGKWVGTLGGGSANAWTSMPGEQVYGAVLEGSVGRFPNIIAHELGHYIGLDHYGNTSNVMNPVIGDGSTTLYREQCLTARQTARDYWQRMIR